VSAASIRLLLGQDWAGEIARIESGLRTGLTPAAELDAVADVRVLGAIGVIETREVLPMDALQDVVLEHGVWIRPFGKLVYTMPPYISTDEDVATITAAMVEAVLVVSGAGR
jgi:adenosylmethionine---8-amino-7-oxononanoate aminotransferase